MMTVRMLYRISLIMFLLAGSLSAQEMPEFPKPTKEHEWLQSTAYGCAASKESFGATCGLPQ